MKMKKITSIIIASCIASSVGFSAHAIIDVIRSPQIVYINGQKADLEAYNIAGNNYYKLRDLGDNLGFSVDYDERSNSVVIDTNKQKTENTKVYYIAPDGTIYYPGDVYIDEYGARYVVDDEGDLISKPNITPNTPPTTSGSGKYPE